MILEDGTLLGTIGGGMLEHQVHQAAAEVLADGKPRIVHFQLLGEDVAQTDMLCGGTADVLLEPLLPGDAEARAVYGKVAELMETGDVGALVSPVPEGAAFPQRRRAIVTQKGVVAGELEPVDRAPDTGAILRLARPTLLEAEAGRGPCFVEPLRPEEVVFIFGGGHISTFVAPLAKMVGFRVVVIDDREEFAHRARFPHADRILQLPFAEAWEVLSVSPSSYLVIVTRGHIHDTTVLREAVRRDVAYVGMIGSRRKRNVVYRALGEEGVPKEVLDRVHAPIGLDIDAETPEEIAVSIVAELIQVRARRQRGLALDGHPQRGG
jgi:xanthine dehydrogenase accessory factor